MEALISIIVPVYNVEKYINKCIDSLVNQTYKNIEIILVDDGSTDNSGKICDEYSQKDNRIKVIHQKNAGVSAARKIGYQKSIGGVIGFVDSDDYVDVNMYEAMLKTMYEIHADIVFCDYNSIINEKSNKKYFLKDSKILTKNDGLKYLANDEIKSFMCNKLYKRECIKETDFYNGNVLEDYLCMTDIFNRSDLIYYLHSAFYNYVRRDNSLMNKNSMFKYWSACRYRLEWYEKNYDQYVDLCLNRLVRTSLTCFENKCLENNEKNIIKEYFSNKFKYVIFNRYLNLHKKIKFIAYIYSWR